jgi:cysteine-rich repeat protein
MDSMTRQFGLLCLAALAAAIAACASNSASQCEATGVLCPAGTHCAAAQPICLSDQNLCGNAHVDPGEICDDGNTLDGDGCSHDCKSDETCGNGILDTAAGEVCDDHNTRDGDGCSHDCKSLETCGNGILDIAAGEVCDDGNQVDGDGCSANCRSDERCGNGIVDHVRGEVCDPPGVDGCQPGCMSSGICGNGILDPGEECDNGIDHSLPRFNCDNCDCRSDCVVNRCGDGFAATTPDRTNNNTKAREECDAAHPVDNPPKGDRSTTPTESPTCNIDCTAARCGDGKVNPQNTASPATALGEQCDDGNLVNGDGCDNNCTFPACGNGIMDPGEQCDDGNLLDGDGCDHNCTIPACGNGVVDPGEDCDDGNQVNGDGCDINCTITKCGNHIVDPGEQCDDGNKVNGDTCDNNCTFPTCGNGQVDPGEECDDGNSITGDGCDNNCTIPACGNHVIDPGEQCDDGNKVNGDGCDNNCTFPACGNGQLDPGEQCDDGNKVNGDGCDNNCTFPSCGNGQLDPGEQCDDGGESAQCNADCTLARCGDGKVNGHFKPDGVNVEKCDNLDPITKASLNGVPCDYGHPDCTRCNATCTDDTFKPGGPFCGDGIPQDPFEKCDPATGPSTPLLANADSADCDDDCTKVVCGDGHINSVTELCDDGNTDKCGQCPVIDCLSATVPAAAAISTITASAAQSNDGSVQQIANNDAFTLDDGFGKALTFVFVTASPTTSPLQILFDPANKDASVIATSIVTAIGNQAGFGITATLKQAGGSVVNLKNNRKSSLGNTTIVVNQGLSDFVFGNNNRMLGGHAGDCSLGVGCTSNDDCASNLCTATATTPVGVCVCETDFDCGTGKTCSNGVCSM